MAKVLIDESTCPVFLPQAFVINVARNAIFANRFVDPDADFVADIFMGHLTFKGGVGNGINRDEIWELYSENRWDFGILQDQISWELLADSSVSQFSSLISLTSSGCQARGMDFNLDTARARPSSRVVHEPLSQARSSAARISPTRLPW